MKPALNIAILFTDFGPYHVARIETLANQLKPGQKLFAFRMTESNGEYGWKPGFPESVEVITLSDGPVRSKSDAVKVARMFFKKLKQHSIGVAILPSYSPLANLLCFLSAKVRGCKTILMLDSWSATEQAGSMGKLVKKNLINRFDAAVVAGTPHKQYVEEYGMPSNVVFTGYDVIDNAHFAKLAAQANHGDEHAAFLAQLPSRFFLSLGRFMKKKNLESIVEAFIQLNQSSVDKISLVFVGEGESEAELKAAAKKSGIPTRNFSEKATNNNDQPEIIFFPFQQYDKTPLFFAKCEAFIIASYMEEWGLVVNEAMASGSPVISSKQVGSSFDLVREDVNGFLFDPLSSKDLAVQMQRFVDDPGLSKRMGAKSSELIGEWNINRFADAVQAAIDTIKK